MASASSVRVKRDPKHVHKFKDVETESPVNDEAWRLGENFPSKPVSPAIDILKQHVCKCGATETYDLERRAVGADGTPTKAA